MTEKTRKRKAARYKALDDVTKLIRSHMRSGIDVQFAYYSNPFANGVEIELYDRELCQLLYQLYRRMDKIQEELFG
jgi:hypothetical protein